ncbi:MobF family relaxase [Kitasatospora sp. NPDC051853]|uniref:MobF family relaxase n=1 Tax=Kitasatospora sp. NPDC051853 TaxID=3364058 RepID=UPI0037ADE0F2
MLQIQTMTPGDGYLYFESQTASGDQQRPRGCSLSVHQLESGLPAGVWVGSAVGLLGVEGEVTEAQLRALFGEGLHPRADALVDEAIRSGMTAEGALAAAQLGTAFYRFGLAGAASTVSAASRAQRPEQQNVSGEDRKTSARRTSTRQPVAGFHAVLQPPSSVSQLWALCSDKVRLTIERAQDDAVAATLVWVEENALATRGGRNGIVQERVTTGLVGVRFRHFDSRAGDPGLHDHVLIANRVLRADGKWRTLDARHLLGQMVAASEYYNAQVLHHVCAALDAAAIERPREDGLRPVTEIAGVDARLLAVTARRSVAIEDRLVRLLEMYRARHGHEPSSVARVRLRRRATLETRPAKKTALGLPELRARWRSEVTAALGPALVDGLVEAVTAAARRLGAAGDPGSRLNVPKVAAATVEAVSTHRAVFGLRHVRAEVFRQITRASHGRADPARWAEPVLRFALDRLCVELGAPDSARSLPPLTRADGSSVYRDQESRVFSTPAVLAAERRLLRAARTRIAPSCPAGRFDAHRRRHRGKLDDGQAAMAKDFATSTRLLSAAIGPAGAGKTSALLLAAKAVRAEGRQVVALAPSARAASVLGEALGQNADTVHRWLALPAPPLRRGDLIVVDEAGMASTLHLAAIVDRAKAVGAHVRLVGDPSQLAAVEAGGALRLLQADGHAVQLTRVHRFTTPGEAEASLVLRDGSAEEAFRWYRENGRIHSGDEEAVLDAAFAAWSKDRAAGRNVVLAAPTRSLVKALNLRAQQALSAQDTLVPGKRDARLHDGTRAHVGETIVTRRNARQLTCLSGRDFVKNGDTWTILGYTPGGGARVRHTRHRGTLTLPAKYLAHHVELGYAATVHRSQGMTVDVSHTVLTSTTSREAAYVGATRGRHGNELYVAVAARESADSVLRRIAASSDQVPGALETLRAEKRRSRDIPRLAAEYADVARRADEARYGAALQYVLGTPGPGITIHPLVAGAVRRAERRGLLPWQVMALAHHATPAADAPTLADHIDRLATTAPDSPGRSPWNAEQDAVLHGLTRTREIAARTALESAQGKRATTPTPVTVNGRSHPAWSNRPHGSLSSPELGRATRRQRQHTKDGSAYLNGAAERRRLKSLEDEQQLRALMDRQDHLREDAQRSLLSGLGPIPSTRQIRRALRSADEDSAASARRYWALAVRLRADRNTTTPPTDHRLPPAWLCPTDAISDPFTPDDWKEHLIERQAEIGWLLDLLGVGLAEAPPPWARFLGSPPDPTRERKRQLWQQTAAHLKVWRDVNGIDDHLPAAEPRTPAARSGPSAAFAATVNDRLSQPRRADPYLWASTIPAPEAGNAQERQLHTRLIASCVHWRVRHRITTADPLGPAPADPLARAEWDALNDALNAYTADHGIPPHTPVQPSTTRPDAAPPRKPRPSPVQPTRPHRPDPHRRPRP